MDIIEHITIVNKMKLDNADTKEIDTITIENVSMNYNNWRRKVNKLGYKCVNNQFIKCDVKENISVTNDNIEILNNTIENKVCNPDSNINSDTYRNTQSNLKNSYSVTNAEIEIMKKEIAELKTIVLAQQDVINTNKMQSEKPDTINRSFRVSISVLNEFMKVCKDNKVKQVNALNRALEMYISEFTKNK